MSTLYAWAAPAFLHHSPVDHTWVTTYDAGEIAYDDIESVVTAGEDYWYCWGSFHGRPDRAMGAKPGDRPLAQCICLPNVPSHAHPMACGTIYTYGIDGVCHQLANQILWATGALRVAPLTVRRARGYHTSTFLFGTYGRQSDAWRLRLRSCGVPPGIGEPGAGVMVTSEPPDFSGDEFESAAREVLGDDVEALTELLALRESASLAIAELHTKVLAPDGAVPQIDRINELYNGFFAHAEALLGRSRYEQLFGVPADTAVNLLDPEMYDGAGEPLERDR